MRRRATLLAAAAALLACRRPAPQPPPSSPLAEVEGHGRVWRTHPGGAAEPLVAGPLASGDLVSTGPDGHAAVRLAGERQLELGPGARMRLRSAPDGRLVVEMESGVVTSRSGPGGKLDLAILTPFGITRVPGGRGEVSVSVDGQGARIAVALGAVTFIDKDGRPTRVGEHQSIAVSVGKIELLRPGAPGGGEAERLADVMLSADDGRLRMRGPGDTRWSTLRAGPAPPGTLFETSGSARLMIVMGTVGGSPTPPAMGSGAPSPPAPDAMDGARGRLAAGAAGRIGEARRQTGRGLRLELALDRGSSLLSFEGGDELVLGDPAAPVVVAFDGPATLSVAAEHGGRRLTVLAGAAQVTVGETRRRLDPTLRGEVIRGRLEVRPRLLADVILPTARGLRVYADGLPEVTLSWPAALGEATIEVADDAEFKELLVRGTAAGSVTVPAPTRGELHWRVTGHDRVLVGQARFAPDRRRSALDLERPRNLVTEAGPVTTVYFQSALPALTFSFAGRPDAARYRVRVYRDDELGKPVVDRLVPGTTCAVDNTPLREGRYLWHAIGLDHQGRELGGGGRMNRLELVYDNALTTLAIGSPRPDEPVSGPHLEASGVAPLGSKLYINGQATPLDAKGRFTVSLERRPALVFRLVGPDGGERFWVRRVKGGS